jgi:GNAT superfamily N-acetyltransferase
MLAIETVPHIQYRIGDNNITIRPMTSDDSKQEADFVRDLSFQSKHDRFFEGVKELSPNMLKKLCDIDGKNVMAFIATIQDMDKEKQIGVSRYATGTLENESEIAVTVADDWQHQGIGKLLMKPLLEYAKNNGIKKLYSIDLASNVAMHHLADDFGMTARRDPDDAQLVKYSLLL